MAGLTTTCPLQMRLLSTFLKRKLANGSVKSVHVEYVKRTLSMWGLFERTGYASYLLSSFTLLFTFSLYSLWGKGGGGVVNFD